MEDLPLRDRLSDDDLAVEEYFRGSEAGFVRSDLEAGIEYTAAATTRDPTFAIAQFALYSYLVSANRSEEAIDAIRATIGNLYRVPERTRLYVKAEYYFLMQELDQADAVTRMWVDLYPDDSYALTYRRTMQDIRGDRKGALATLQTMSELDPRNGGLLKQIADAHEDLGDDEQALAVLSTMDAWLDEASGFMSPMMLTLSRDDDINIFCAGGLADGGRGLRAGAEGEGEAGGTFGLTGAHPGALPRPPVPGTIFPWRPPKTLPPGNPRAPVSRAS